MLYTQQNERTSILPGDIIIVNVHRSLFLIQRGGSVSHNGGAQIECLLVWKTPRGFERAQRLHYNITPPGKGAMEDAIRCMLFVDGLTCTWRAGVSRDAMIADVHVE